MHSVSKTINVMRSTAAGCISKLSLVVLHLISRRLFLRYIGLDYLSVAQVINSILTVFSFSEMGLFNSVLYMLYKPVSENDLGKINRLVSQYRIFNRGVGIVIVALGIIFAPFLPFFVKTEVPIQTVYLIYILQLLVTGSTYFMSYRRILLSAQQQDYIISVIDMIVNSISTVVQCILIVLFKEYLIYLIVAIVFSLVGNILVFLYTGTKYPYIKNCLYVKALPDEKLGMVTNIKAMFSVKIAGIVINNTDNLLVSWIDTIMVGLCSNYMTISLQFKTMISMLQQALFHSMGIACAEKTGEEQYRLFKKAVLANTLIANLLCVPLGVLWDDFIVLWIGPDYIVDKIIVFSMLLNFCTYIIKAPSWIFRDANGLFVYVKKMLLLNAMLNLIISIILGKWIGIAGVFIGTEIADLFSDFFYDIWILYSKIFKKEKCWRYNLYNITSIVIIFGEIFLINQCTQNWCIDWTRWLLKGVMSVGMSLTVFVVLHFRTHVFKEFMTDSKKLFLYYGK